MSRHRISRQFAMFGTTPSWRGVVCTDNAARLARSNNQLPWVSSGALIHGVDQIASAFLVRKVGRDVAALEG